MRRDGSVGSVPGFTTALSIMTGPKPLRILDLDYSQLSSLSLQSNLDSRLKVWFFDDDNLLWNW